MTIRKNTLLTFLLSAMSVVATAQTHEFTVATYNIDGKPDEMYGITLNDGGPESEGTTKIAQKLLETDWDIIGFNEDFNYHSELSDGMSSNYTFGAFRGGLNLWDFIKNGLRVSSDGLGFAVKKEISFSKETIIEWCGYSGRFDKDNDGLAYKGFRSYLVDMPWGLQLDVYILHADAGKDQKDADIRVKQFEQLADSIISANSGRPKVVMGDYNCFYDRDELKSFFIDRLNADDHLTTKDAVIELHNDGIYPACSHILDQAELTPANQETLDHIMYINDDRASWTLKALDYQHVMSFVYDDGKQISDHEPVSLKLSATYNDPSGIRSIEHDGAGDAGVRKMFVNGKLIIVKKGVSYNIDGTQVIH